MGRRRPLDGLSPDQSKFLDWLIEPSQTRLPKTQTEFAREIHANERTLRDWKKLPEFREAWDRRLADINVSPDRIQDVINSVWSHACRGNMKAAELYLKYIDRFRDVREVITTTSVEEMDDDELEEAYQGFISQVVEDREAAEAATRDTED